jgi:hypothetical protein
VKTGAGCARNACHVRIAIAAVRMPSWLPGPSQKT